MALPLAAWTLHLGNTGLPRQLAWHWLGPPSRPSPGSAPPYLQIDILVMGLAVLVLAAALLVLLAAAVMSLRRP